MKVPKRFESSVEGYHLKQQLSRPNPGRLAGNTIDVREISFLLLFNLFHPQVLFLREKYEKCIWHWIHRDYISSMRVVQCRNSCKFIILWIMPTFKNPPSQTGTFTNPASLHCNSKISFNKKLVFKLDGILRRTNLFPARISIFSSV